MGKSVALRMLMAFLVRGTGSDRVNDPGHDSPVAALAPDAVGFILAGGQSSRMGRDKAQLLFAGRPLIAHALRPSGAGWSSGGDRRRTSARPRNS